MRTEFINIPLQKNSQNNRFELTIDGHTAFIDYKEDEQIIKLIHTESPTELAGRGAATALIEKTLQYIKDNKYSLIPLCPLVFAFIKKNPDWKIIVNPNFRGIENL